MIIFNPDPPIKCKHCNKTKGQHRASTYECPSGMKTRIGHTSFGPTVYEPKISKKKKA